MGTRARSSTPDLFSSALTREAHSRSSESSGSSPAIIHKTPSAIPSHHVLPADLPNAVRHLDDQELDQLTSAVIAEQKRRGKKLPAEISRKRRVELVAAVPLTQAKLNAVRAAFKAGVTPSRIAPEFHSPMYARHWRLISQNGESTCRSCVYGNSTSNRYGNSS
jgi:hypothetical protein